MCPWGCDSGAMGVRQWGHGCDSGGVTMGVGQLGHGSAIVGPWGCDSGAMGCDSGAMGV